eukprot:Skav216382  [mRNA]  locus=scaffold1241:118826:120190:+ [translate_table: standard]
MLVLLSLCHWLRSDRTYSPLQVLVASPIPGTFQVPQSLDSQELKACAPRLFDPDGLKDLIAEARGPKWKPRKQPRPRRSADKPGLWRCSECERWLPETDFHIQTSSDRPMSYCKKCNCERVISHHSTLRGSLLHFMANARDRAKRKLWNSTLNLESLADILERQKGRCAYSGVPMEIHMTHSHWRMSLERLNNSKGYTLENCVLIAAEFNTGDFSRQKGVKAATVKGSAQWSCHKVKAVFHLRRQPENLTMLEEEIKDAEIRPKSNAKRSQAVQPRQAVKEEECHMYCCACDMFLSPSNFSASQQACGGRKCCRACKSNRDRARRSTLRGHMQECLSSARGSARKRNQEFSLTLLQALHMLKEQHGRCYYSGVPLEYKQIHTDWRLSIERLNNSIGYTEENCVLIAIEFNTADHSRNKAVTKVFGTAQWSREKVEHIWGDSGWATKTFGNSAPA